MIELLTRGRSVTGRSPRLRQRARRSRARCDRARSDGASGRCHVTARADRVVAHGPSAASAQGRARRVLRPRTTRVPSGLRVSSRRDVPRSDVLHASGAARASEGRVLHARRAHGDPSRRAVIASRSTRGEGRSSTREPIRRRSTSSTRVSTLDRYAGRAPGRTSGPYVLFVGALEPRKDVPTLIAAFEGAGRPARPRARRSARRGGRLRSRQRSRATKASIRRTGYVAEDGEDRALSGRARRSCTRRSPRGSASRCSKRWHAARRWSRRRARPPRRSRRLRAPRPAARRHRAHETRSRRVLTDTALSDDLRRRGPERARTFTWEAAAAATVDVWQRAAASSSMTDRLAVVVLNHNAGDEIIDVPRSRRSRRGPAGDRRHRQRVDRRKRRTRRLDCPDVRLIRNATQHRASPSRRTRASARPTRPYVLLLNPDAIAASRARSHALAASARRAPASRRGRCARPEPRRNGAADQARVPVARITRSSTVSSASSGRTTPGHARTCWRTPRSTRRVAVDWVACTATALRREAFESVGGFDEAYFFFVEDVDLCRRLSDAGWEIWFEPAAEAVHAWGVSWTKRPMKFLWMHQWNLFRYVRKHRRGAWVLAYPLIAAGSVRPVRTAGITVADHERSVPGHRSVGGGG